MSLKAISRLSEFERLSFIFIYDTHISSLSDSLWHVVLGVGEGCARLVVLLHVASPRRGGYARTRRRAAAARQRVADPKLFGCSDANWCTRQSTSGCAFKIGTAIITC